MAPDPSSLETAAAPAAPTTSTSMKFSLKSCRTSTSTTWNGCDGTATITVSKPVTSGYVSLVLNYGCGSAYTCNNNWHGELRVSSTTPGSIVIPITSTSLPRSLCTSPMSTVANVFDSREGRGDQAHQLYSQSFAITLDCGSAAPTPPSATSAQFNGSWQGTFTGEASGFLEFSISGSVITIEEPEEGTGTLSLSTVYGSSSFVTRSETRSCTWTGPFLPGGARQSNANGLWSCTDSSSRTTRGQWSATRTSATTPPTTPPPTGGSGFDGTYDFYYELFDVESLGRKGFTLPGYITIHNRTITSEEINGVIEPGDTVTMTGPCHDGGPTQVLWHGGRVDADEVEFGGSYTCVRIDYKWRIFNRR